MVAGQHAVRPPALLPPSPRSSSSQVLQGQPVVRHHPGPALIPFPPHRQLHLPSPHHVRIHLKIREIRAVVGKDSVVTKEIMNEGDEESENSWLD